MISKESSKIKDSGKRSFSSSRNTITPQIMRVETRRNWDLFIFKATDFADDETFNSHSIMKSSSRDDIRNNENSFHNAMKTMIVIGQCFGLMPVVGICERNASRIRFKWCTLRVLYSVSQIVADLFMIVCCCLQYAYYGISFSSSACVVFYGCSAAGRLLFFHLAKQWPEIARHWECTELSLCQYSYPTRLRTRIRRISITFLFLSLFEHTCSITSTVFESLQCHKKGAKLVRDFFYRRNRHVFINVSYNIVVGLLSVIVSFTATFVWNYMSLFIILISIGIVERLKQVNKTLENAREKVLPYTFWRQIREDYNNLSYLTKILDEKLSKLILLTFGCNLYFMCLRLLYTIKKVVRVDEIVYFVVAFGFMLFRTCAVCLYASSIHDKSKEPKSVLYTVPANGYSIEVQRFLQQVTSDDVMLTGLNFFAITRGLVLTIAGTIVTYEIVLVQFNSLNDNSFADNTTVDCINIA